MLQNMIFATTLFLHYLIVIIKFVGRYNSQKLSTGAAGLWLFTEQKSVLWLFFRGFIIIVRFIGNHYQLNIFIKSHALF